MQTNNSTPKYFPTQNPADVKGNVMIPGSNVNLPTPAEFFSANTNVIPSSFSVGVTSASGTSAAATRVYILNETAAGLNNQVTNNGSGASSITYSYTDGFGGRVISRALGQSRMGIGEVCKGVAIRVNNASTGAGLPTSLANTNPYFAVFNFFNTPIALNVNVNAMQKRTDQDTSIEVVRITQNLTAFTQFTFVADASGTSYGTTTTVTFYLTDNFSV